MGLHGAKVQSMVSALGHLQDIQWYGTVKCRQLGVGTRPPKPFTFKTQGPKCIGAAVQ